MQSFLEEVAAYVLEQYPEQTGEICIVTPNRRAGLFLRKQFGLKVTKPAWSPAFMSIEDFVNHISGCKVTDKLSLLFQFYEVYCSIEKENAEGIDEFLGWGSMLLRDFDEIDSALKNPSELYAYLYDTKYIETWNPDGSALTGFQQNYLDFFKKFNTWHTALKNHLESKKLAYQGMSYRKAATMLESNTVLPGWQKVIFAGFNALNQAEESIIDSLVKAGKAEVICDSDPYYEKNPQHEAGHFVRKYRAKWLKPMHDTPSLFSNPKTIQVLGIAQNLNQAQLAGNLLSNGILLNEQTAVVLANENLLVPVLNALPEEASSVNVTMGYPLAKTNLFGFFEAFMQLYITADRLNKANQGSAPSFHYKDLLRFFNNSCTSILCESASKINKTEELIKQISLSNRTFYSFEDLAKLKDIDGEFLKTFAFLSENLARQIGSIIPVMKDICDRLDQAFRQKAEAENCQLQKSPYFIDFESLYYFGRILSRTESLLGSSSAIKSIGTLWKILKQSVAETRLAFSGEPLEGLQVMGVLETRNLDFKNVVLLSVNEDIIPKAKSNNSFIPFDVKRKFGLQVHTDQDAVFSYHFYRLLQRAENIFLIYNTESGGMGSGEKSRFITQLQHELPAFNPAISLSHRLVSLSPEVKTGEQVISIEKTTEVMTRLIQIAETGFSPSSLNIFISCPLKFYLEKVARLREVEEVEETIEASTLGNVVHGVLEDLYNPFRGTVLSPQKINEMLPKVQKAIEERFANHYPDGDITSGKNLLMFNLAKRYVENFLKAEISQLEEYQSQNVALTLIDTEATLLGIVEVIVNGAHQQVKITGKTDRIDKLGNVIRIIDYKTGKVKQPDLKVDLFEKIIEDKKYEKAFQVLAYTWLYLQKETTGYEVESGIFSMRNLKEGLLKATINDDSAANANEEFGEQMSILLTRIMDPAQPFNQTQKQENCKYCSFQALCKRFESNDPY